MTPKALEPLLARGAAWMVEHGYGAARDVEFAEASGALEGADAGAVSDRAKERGRPQVGTLGSGNHFLEVQYVERVEDEPAARAYGLSVGQVVVLIHSGSRGLGHQIGTEFLKRMAITAASCGIQLPDRELACAPINSDVGQDYLGAMRKSG